MLKVDINTPVDTAQQQSIIAKLTSQVFSSEQKTHPVHLPAPSKAAAGC